MEKGQNIMQTAEKRLEKYIYPLLSTHPLLSMRVGMRLQKDKSRISNTSRECLRTVPVEQARPVGGVLVAAPNPLFLRPQLNHTSVLWHQQRPGQSCPMHSCIDSRLTFNCPGVCRAS